MTKGYVDIYIEKCLKIKQLLGNQFSWKHPAAKKILSEFVNKVGNNRERLQEFTALASKKGIGFE